MADVVLLTTREGEPLAVTGITGLRPNPHTRGSLVYTLDGGYHEVLESYASLVRDLGWTPRPVGEHESLEAYEARQDAAIRRHEAETAAVEERIRKAQAERMGEVGRGE